MTDDTDRGIRAFAWARDARHLLYIQDTGGDENWRLYDVDMETGAKRDLTPYDGIQARIIATRKSHRDEILVGMNRDNPQLHDVYRLSLTTGELTKLIENPGFAGWLADEDMLVRGAIAPLPDGGYDVLVRDDADSDWRTLLTFPADDASASDVLAFTGDGKSLLAVSSAGVNTGRLVRVDLASGDTEVLFEDPDVDVEGAVLHPDTREPQIVEVVKDRAEYHVLDPSVAADVEAIRALHSGDPGLSGRDEADKTWLVAFNDDAGPIRYYAYDRASRPAPVREPSPAVTVRAGPHGAVLLHQPGRADRARVRHLPARRRADRPARGAQRTRRAAGAGRVGLGPGGPVAGQPGLPARPGELPRLDRVRQSVRQRGRPRVGRQDAGRPDRRGAVRDRQGWADPDRVAIYGGSYGGYAALAGAAFTPDVFRCAVDIVGPSNLQTLLESIPPYWAPMKAQLYKRVGNAETDQEFLWSRSPLSRARDIRIPLLIAQGANDPRVKQAESEQIVAALAEAGIDYEYMLFPDEGHGFAKPENRLKFYAAAERFLAKHLGGRFED